MRSIYLDLLHRKRPTPKAGWLLMGIGSTLIVAVLLADTFGESALAKELQTAQQLRGQSPDTGLQARTLKESGRAEAIISDPPWDRLFTRLEQTRPSDILLLQLEADGANGTATLVGGAESPDKMLAYLARLSAESSFYNVVLAQHIEAERGSSRSVRFTVRMNWGSR